MMSFWYYIAGPATFILFFLLTTLCCIFHKRNKEPYYANTRSQQVRDSSKDQTIYENDHELRKKIYTGKSQFSSVYINRPENKLAIYVNSTPNAETYENGIDDDYENVEMFDGTHD
ncbi:hypothetical protein E1301_Tti012243 [Triplophysa tibetana]|uniref:Uncharacterized protein n=1 Tax=Triplophysa tibetana TaxID=1572043 RepID=A0A5A9P5W3_9TELE|nr:hypothetical protein E1301_Tti012243 [Triplophysa tibetana]